MEFFLELLLGPLAAIECRRSLSRDWVLVLRGLAAVPPAVVALAVLWFWWFQEQIMAGYSPGGALAWGLMGVEAMFVTVALLLGQALLAGTLAGEKLRSTSLLLATQASSAQIVLGRLAGRLCVVAVVMAAGLPILVWFAALCELGPLALATLLLLPAAVSFGGGGFALAVSTVARSARDALLMVYLFEFLLLLAPLLGGRFLPSMRPWIEPLNPFQAIRPLVEFQDAGPAMLTVAMWTLLGAAGCAGAAWRLRPAFLSSMDEPRRRWRWFRSVRVPVLANRPMLWKELYVEQVQAFGRIVKWLGILVIAIFSGTSIFLAGLVAWDWWFAPDADEPSWALGQLTEWLGWSWLTAWLIQWALGLRAAAAITSERQRGTWDSLLVSPLEAREIIWAKLCGSIHGLRGLLAAIVLAWTTGAICGALTIGAFAELLAQTLAIGGFMAAAGIAFSLSCESATRSMTGTIVCWLAAGCVFAALAGIVTLIVLFVWLLWNLFHGIAPGPGPTGWPAILYQAIRLAFYALAALLTAAYIQRRFDSLAGRSCWE
jgi:ABC-type transport system involved in multi-copper enzyme maturation permease subunit